MNECVCSFGGIVLSRKTRHIATLSIAKPTWIGLRLNPGFCGETLAADRTVHGTVLDPVLIILNPVDTLTLPFQFCCVQCFLRAQYKKKEWLEWWTLERQINKKMHLYSLIQQTHSLWRNKIAATTRFLWSYLQGIQALRSRSHTFGTSLTVHQ